MNLFANAAYGIVPSEEIQLKLEQAIVAGNSEKMSKEEVEWSECVKTAHDLPAVRKILQELQMPFAHILLVEKTEDGTELEEGTLIVGWGLLAFPDIAMNEWFRWSKNAVPSLGMDWHLWVSS